MAGPGAERGDEGSPNACAARYAPLLLALVLAPLMLGFPLIMGVLWYWGEVYHRLMVSRVASDLATAHGGYSSA